MNNYRDIFLSLAKRSVPAVVVYLVGWRLLASAEGGWAAVWQLLVGMACLVAAAVILAPPLARLAAEPWGSLFWPGKRLDRSPPVYSIPQSMRAKGMYEEAIRGFEKISEEHPDEVKPYVEMIDIAIVNLRDAGRARQIYRRGISRLKSVEDREILARMCAAISTRLRTGGCCGSADAGLRISREAWNHPDSPGGVERLSYAGRLDGLNDWALAMPPARGRTWIVHLHGHGSGGDQLFTRPDLRAMWLPRYLELGLGILSPNLRGNAWMCPEAAADLRDLLNVVRSEHGACKFCFVSGSMGGAGNLIYAALHPEDVALVVALCPATDIASYFLWCRAHPGGVRDEIRDAMELAYGGPPELVSDRYAAHCVTALADRLMMPMFLSHATGDEVIPVEQSRELLKRLAGKDNLAYVEIDGGNHDSPLHGAGMLEWLDAALRE